MTETFVRYEYADGVARLTLADGDRGNPIHPESVAQMLAGLRAAKRDAAQVIVLAAEGRFFSVGGDLGAFADQDDPTDFLDDLAESLHRVVSEFVRNDAIVVTVVQGAAAGAGFPLAALGDIVVASEKAKFSLAYGKVGLTPDGGSSMLVHTLGLHRTLRLAILGDMLTAQEAADAGLVARVVPAEELAATVDEVVATLMAGSASASAGAKKLFREAAAPAIEAALRKETLSIRAQSSTPDGREGVAAFVAKRAPKFGN